MAIGKAKLEKHINGFVEKSYVAFCRLPKERLKVDGTLQQTTIPVSVGSGSPERKVLLSVGIYGGKFAAYAALLDKVTDKKEPDAPVNSPDSVYGLIGEADPKMQVWAYEEDPARLELRSNIIASMLDALGSATVGLSEKAQKAQKEIAGISTFKVSDHPGTVPQGSIEVLRDETERVLNLIRAIADDPNSEALTILKEMVKQGNPNILSVEPEKFVISTEGNTSVIRYAA